MYMDYEEEAKIDIHSLEDEWIHQPGLFIKYADAAADARLAMDQAKTGLETMIATIALEARNNPDKFGIGKVTEGTISEAVDCHPKVIKAKQDYHQATHDHVQLQGHVRGFDQRKSALENLVKLIAMGYHSTPNSERVKPQIDEETSRGKLREGGKQTSDRMQKRRSQKSRQS